MEAVSVTKYMSIPITHSQTGKEPWGNRGTGLHLCSPHIPHSNKGSIMAFWVSKYQCQLGPCVRESEMLGILICPVYIYSNKQL